MGKLEEFMHHEIGVASEPACSRQACRLAAAARWALEDCVRYTWQKDRDGAEVEDEDGEMEVLPAVECLAEHLDGRRASLSGITESDNRWTRAEYRMLVQAELALEMATDKEIAQHAGTLTRWQEDEEYQDGMHYECTVTHASGRAASISGVFIPHAAKFKEELRAKVEQRLMREVEEA